MIKNDEILALLKKHIDAEIEYTLEFREVYTGALVTLVKKAYEAGMAAAQARVE